MKKIIAKKVNMTQIFSETGEVFPVTLVKELQGKALSDDLQGPDDLQGLALQEGDMVTVSGTSKGKGFQGVVKRHGFTGGPRSHGQKHSEREPGSIGGGGRAGGRVIKGMRMAGRMGGERVTVKNLKIIKILPETREIFIQGALPGRRGTLLEIKKLEAST
ncbi:MAG: 50S ribosomal protein L3 [Parcubacteria group bacterium GW2011_GWC1_43_30]|nr:MAG: 50S ribosomal protein L3 [Parcubacteria group bacterium GW2011_GWC1_43_30]